ncbi:MAG TPA: DUF655 domain-containing protein [Burkholderiaceae bacterium]|nr:DUF655 domain-containing protein [Burkholderiaceae bacterium]
MTIRLRLVAALIAYVVASQSIAVDLNHASRSDIERMPGVGVTSAERILQERERAGPFASWDDFQQRVPGFRDRKIEALKKFGVTIASEARDKIDRPPE